MRRASTRALVVAGLAVSLLLAGVVSFYASSHPDGLAYVAGKVGFSQTAKQHASTGSPFAGYSTQGVSNQRLSGGVAGVVGVLVVALIGGGLAWGLRRRSTPATDGQAEAPPEAQAEAQAEGQAEGQTEAERDQSSVTR